MNENYISQIIVYTSYYIHYPVTMKLKKKVIAYNNDQENIY